MQSLVSVGGGGKAKTGGEGAEINDNEGNS